jgi:hypothetical protein
MQSAADKAQPPNLSASDETNFNQTSGKELQHSDKLSPSEDSRSERVAAESSSESEEE